MEEQKSENSSNLEDIILGKKNKSDKSEGIKKLLLIIASLILLFLIVLVIMKLISQPNIEEESSAIDLTQEKEKIVQNDIPEEEKFQEIQKEKPKTDNNEQLFKEVPIMQEEDDKEFEEMVRKLKEQEERRKKEVERRLKEKNERKTKTERIVQKESGTTTKKIEVIDQKLEDLEKNLNEISNNGSKKIKETIKSVTSKPVTKKVSSLSGYYIQVGATYQIYPDKAFLNKIKANGFSYIIHKVVIGGKDVRKVLVGPYKSRAEAMKYLGTVRATIRNDAFIYRVR